MFRLNYRSVSSESPQRIAKTASTAAPIVSKSYYSEPDQSYPYYTIYDDDVSIYKDDGMYITKVHYFFPDSLLSRKK